MKKYVSIVLLVALILLNMITVINASNMPMGGGKNIFNVQDIMYPGDDGTLFHNAFTQPTVMTPSGTYEHWSGVYFTETTYKGIECVAVSIDPEGDTLSPVMDFNYYQWDSEYYNPSLSGGTGGWIKIMYAYNEARLDCGNISFWASKDVTPIATANLKSAKKTFLGSGCSTEWRTEVFKLDGMMFEDGSKWEENSIRQFRLYMFNGNKNKDAVCYIGGFGFFESKEEAYKHSFDNLADVLPTEPKSGSLEVETWTDFEYGEYVNLKVLIDGKEQIIKVDEFYTTDAEGELSLTRVTDLSYSNLSKFLKSGVSGKYSYFLGTDGLYTISQDVDNNEIEEEVKEANDIVVNETRIAGDLSGDFKVTSRDVTYLSRHIAQWTGYGKNDVMVEAGDVNNSGSVTPLDTIILARHIAKWIGYETLPYGG